jgi:hypothetical protein
VGDHRRGRVALRKHRLWTPLQVRRLTREINATLGKVLAEYTEAHAYVFERRDSATDENQGLRISNSGTSDPTGEAVVSQEDNRRRLAQAARKLEHAAQEIDAASVLIKRVFSSPDDYYRPLESYRP